MAQNFAEVDPLDLLASPDALNDEQRKKLQSLGFNPNDQKALAKLQMRARVLRAQRARKDPNAFCAYVLRDERSNKPIKQAPMHATWHALLSKHDRLNMWSHVEGGKALALDTLIPTPSGFTTMGALRAGDSVLGGDGRPVRVLHAYPVRYDRACFRVRFDDGAELIADGEHNWLAWSLDDLNSRNTVKQPRVITTLEMKERLKRGRDFMWKVPIAPHAAHEARTLPLPAYVLGAWLGDGHSADSKITFHENDRAVWERCRDLVGSCDPIPDARNPHVFFATLGPTSSSRAQDGMRAALRALGVLGNKHIPLSYLTASEADRRELLAGLLDTDGCAVSEPGRKKSRVEFCSSSKQLAEDVLQLARSLGFKARLAINASKLYGRKIGDRYRVTFTATEPVFRLERKQALLRRDGDKPRTKTVVAIEPIASVPVRCITVESSDRVYDQTYLAGDSYTITHNTNQVAIGRSLYELGKDPSLKIAIISNTNDLAKKITRQLGQYITKSKELHEVFPNLVPTDDPGLPWKAQALTVQRPGMGAKDPSVQAAGMHGNIIGSRIDLLILDDVLDFENTNTPTPREDAYRWLKYIMGRMTSGGRVWVIGNAWHPDDAMHRFEKDGFVSVRFPVILADGTITWPERWPLERIERAKGPDGLGPLEFARQLMCQARDDTSARFKREWIDSCIEAGRCVAWVDNVEQLFDEENMTDEEREEALAADTIQRLTGKGGIITGVDLAVSKGDSADSTVLFTIYVDAMTGKRRVLNVRSGKWTGPEIINEIERCYKDFGGLFIVENNAAQDYIRQFLNARGTNVPVVPFTTGRNKAHPEFGVEALATELAGAKWLIPSVKRGEKEAVIHKELLDWISELLFYDPKEHTGDRVMASWFAREGARKFIDGRHGGGDVTLRTF